MEKQIEEIAKVICEDCAGSGTPCREPMCDAVLQNAKALYDAGYRKQSEVVNEIFAEIEKKIAAALESNYNARQYFELSDDLYHVENGKISALRGIEGFIEELKKKYTNN